MDLAHLLRAREGAGGCSVKTTKRRHQVLRQNTFQRYHQQQASNHLLLDTLPHSSFPQREVSSLPCWVPRLQRVQTLDGHLGCVNTIKWSPDGKFLISGSDDTKVWPSSLGMTMHEVDADTSCAA
jgi:WD40 repeat protein